MSNSTSGELKPTLGLVEIIINAMALIAPSAFLWTTYQLQAPPDSAKKSSILSFQLRKQARSEMVSCL
ncbi:MAG: hypothetical protein KME10_25655 [Plectolyngbya sp. WJT66-NPBG17]|nr:hypothetical protein [Plectolyngbya sp. WJT66-NPBG17]MBW4525959.1 hypothetical protein [Phormidium tanganyikae FI6-MK23]